MKLGPFRAVRIIARMNVGGPALNAINLSAGLADEFPTLLITGNVGAGEKDMAQEAQRSGIPIHTLPALGPSLDLGSDTVALAKLVRLLRAVRPDIVHTHTAKAGALGRTAAVLAGVPTIVHTFHGHVFHGYFSPTATRAALAVERALARYSHAIVTVSDAVARELVEDHAIVSRERMHVIPLGFDFSRFRLGQRQRLRAELRAELNAGDRKVVSIVGRLEPIKNHALFLQAAARLQATRGDVLFLVVGGGTLLPRLQQLAAELDIADTVRFVGWRSDIERIYAGSDAVALTSDNEGTPVCLIEALVMGVPVVSTRVGGVPDVLENGRLGTMVPAGDADALARALAAALENRPCKADITSALVREKYSISRLLNDTRTLYRSLVSRTGVRVKTASGEVQ